MQPYELMRKPVRIIHCDWSTSEKKRWAAVATLTSTGLYEVQPPALVGDLSLFLSGLKDFESLGATWVGFDFPIGIPRAYSSKTGFTSFPDMLLHLGSGQWSQYYKPASTPDEISVKRPFYPNFPGSSKKQYLLDGLGLVSPDQLLRRCDFATNSRGSASELFWLIGAKQVGKAAIAGWKNVLTPAVRDHGAALWPFDGDLEGLVENRSLVLAETYPAEIYGHIGIPRSFGKTKQTNRQDQADAILSWCQRLSISLSSEVVSKIEDGFGPSPLGEDPFDTLIGLLGMIEVVSDPTQFNPPGDPAVRRFEGWILGQRALESEGRVSIKSRPIRLAVRSGATASRVKSHEKICPACLAKLFSRWPWGWDSHAAYRCRGIAGNSSTERKENYRRLYL